MLRKSDLGTGVRLELPPFDSQSPARFIRLINIVESSPDKGTEYWMDETGLTWADHYLLNHARLAEDTPVALTNERKSTHGDWMEQSRVFDNLNYQLTISHNWEKLNNMQRAALINIVQKISRIVSGDPNHEDHWDDIAGYAFLGKGRHK